MLHVAWYLVGATLGKGDSTSLVGRSEPSQDACISTLAASILSFLYLHDYWFRFWSLVTMIFCLTACNRVPNPILPRLASSSAVQVVS